MKRWLPAFAMMLVSTISYIDRNTLSLLAPTILRETRFTNEEYGRIISAFSIAYMIGNPIWGRLLDRIGLRTGMSLAVAFWSLASAAHAWAGGFWSFVLARGSLGFGEGATFPGGLRAVTQSLKVHEQARGIALAYSGGSMGAMITPVVMTPVFLAFGWRGAFLATGAFGVAWLLMWAWVSRGMTHEPAEALTAPPIRLLDSRVWAFVLAYSLGAIPLGFILYMTALYLNQQLGADQVLIGKVLWIPPLGWEVGYFVWGWWLDRLTKAGVDRPTAVGRLMFLAMWLSLPLAVVPMLTSLPLTMAFLFLAMFVTVGFVLPSVQHAIHLYSPAHSGLIGGIGAGSFGMITALTMPWFGRMFDQKRYQIAFLLAALLPIVGYSLWRWINSRYDDARAASTRESSD